MQKYKPCDDVAEMLISHADQCLTADWTTIYCTLCKYMQTQSYWKCKVFL